MNCLVGTVISQQGSHVEVEVERGSACSGCHSKSACMALGSTSSRLWIKTRVPVSPGDSVELAVEPGHALKAAALLYFLPTLLFLVGAVLGDYTAALYQSDAWRTPLAIGLGALFMVVSYGIVALGERRRQHSDSQVTVIARRAQPPTHASGRSPHV